MVEEKQYIEAFTAAARHVLKTMAFVKPQVGDVLKRLDNITTGDVTGIVGMTGDKKITLMLSFTEHCILKVVSSMFGEELTTVNSEIRDAVGEFTNMISGDARRRLADEYNLKLDGGIPSVIIAKGHKIESITSTPLTSIEMFVDNEKMTLDIAFDK